MPENIRPNPFQMPKVTAQEVLFAKQQTDKYSSVAHLTEEVFEDMEQKDPYLAGYINDLTEVFTDNNIPVSSPLFLFGAAYMYRLMENLSEFGYPFPKISQATISADRSKIVNTAKAFSNQIEATESQDASTEEALDLLSNTTTQLDLKPLSFEDIYAENPALQEVFESLDMPARSGARYVYLLKRQQILADQMRKNFDR